MDDSASPKGKKKAKKQDKEKPRDLVLVHGRSADGNHALVFRSRKDRLEAGLMRPLEHGRPVEGEVVKLTPRKESPLLFDAETELEVPAASGEDSGSRSASGPAQVASERYRNNWDAIYGRRTRVLN